MTNILGISGKKQSGKTSSGNFLLGCAMTSIELVDYAEIDKDGDLILPYQDGSGGTSPCVFPAFSKHPKIIKYLEDNVWSKIKLYNFADTLKEICIDVLGLSYEQCYGTDEDKNSETDIDITNVFFDAKIRRKMTAREVMQHVGTDFFRRIYPNVWVDATIRKIKKDSPELAVIVDCRFPNEVKGIQDNGGKVVRLTKNVFGEKDQHPSETALDEYEGFDYVLDNSKMGVSNKNQELYNLVTEWGFIDYESVAVSSNQ